METLLKKYDIPITLKNDFIILLNQYHWSNHYHWFDIRYRCRVG
jgi:hypothetical protein